MRRRLLVATGVVADRERALPYGGRRVRVLLATGPRRHDRHGVTVAGIDVGGLHAARGAAAASHAASRASSSPSSSSTTAARFAIRPKHAGLRSTSRAWSTTAVAAQPRRRPRDASCARSAAGGSHDRCRCAPALLDDARRDASSTTSRGSLDRPRAERACVPSRSRRSLTVVPARGGLAVKRRAARARGSRTRSCDPTATRRSPCRRAPCARAGRRAACARRYETYILVSRETFTLRLCKHLKLVQDVQHRRRPGGPRDAGRPLRRSTTSR